MTILGIDPGLATMGWGAISYDGVKPKILDYGALITPPDMPMPQRLMSLYDGVEELCRRFDPDDIAMEELFFCKNVTTAIAVGEARGAALVAMRKHTNNLFEYTPMQIKQAVTGYGKADKKQVQQMVKLLLNLPEIPRPDDAADGLAIAITHAHSMRMRQNYRI
ncbi:MAG: crossover junction endodeoxyribonuclease RuvC [Candidatus Spyradocola sp.]|nr:crossover junction endodeoxyribonuclease RuvC [Candidatus Spyradocola sp.]